MRRAVALTAIALAFLAAEPAAAAVPTRGDLRVLVALVTWGPQPATPAAVQTELASAASWFESTSFSQLHIVAETTPGWLTIPQFSACATINPDLHDAADAALGAAAVDLRRYDVRAYLFPAIGDCVFAGRASLLAGWIELNEEFRAFVIEHELGHSLGLRHSRSTSCVVWRGDCAVDEYGDPYDVMGDGVGPFNGFQQLRLGWIRGTSVERPGTYGVEQLERPSTSPQALTIETASARYVVDHREVSPEPGQRLDPSNGVLVYRWDGDQGPVLLSAGGAAGAYPLRVGRTYEIPGLFTLTPRAHLGTHVDVDFAWTDRTPPNPPEPVDPRDGARLAATDDIVLMWDDALETGSGLAGYALTVDGTLTRLAVLETSWAPERPFGAGTHTWSVAAFDRAGNRADSDRQTFVVGRRSQTVSMLLGGRRCGVAVTAPCRLRGSTLGVVVETSDAPERAAVTVRLARRGAGWRTVVTRTTRLGELGDAAFALPALRPGLWRVTANVAGNVDVSAASKVAYVSLGAR